MPKMLNDDTIKYEDGTPATESQVNLTVISIAFDAVVFYVNKTLIVIYFLSNVFSDGKRCCEIFGVGCEAGNGRKKAGNSLSNN